MRLHAETGFSQPGLEALLAAGHHDTTSTTVSPAQQLTALEVV